MLDYWYCIRINVESTWTSRTSPADVRIALSFDYSLVPAHRCSRSSVRLGSIANHFLPEIVSALDLYKRVDMFNILAQNTHGSQGQKLRSEMDSNRGSSGDLGIASLIGDLA